MTEQDVLRVKIDHIEEDVREIKTDMKAMDARLSGLQEGQARIEAMLGGMSERIQKNEVRTEKLENRLYYITGGIGGGSAIIATLVSKLLG